MGGGYINDASGSYATVGGGLRNTASGVFATVPGGSQNTASGVSSFAAGTGAQAVYGGSFVWADDNGGTFASTAANQFAVRASGGVLLAADVQLAGGAAYHNFSLSGGNSAGYLYGSYPALGDGVHLGYNYYYDAVGNGHPINSGRRHLAADGGLRLHLPERRQCRCAPTTQRLLANSTGVTVNGTFNNSSDRNAKQNFAPVSPAQILERVGATAHQRMELQGGRGHAAPRPDGAGFLRHFQHRHG